MIVWNKEYHGIWWVEWLATFIFILLCLFGTIKLLSWMHDNAYVDRIPVCPTCEVGSSREYLHQDHKWIHAPLIYDNKGVIIRGGSSMKTTFYKCWECQTEYGWYENKYFGEGYHDPNQTFEFNPNPPK